MQNHPPVGRKTGNTDEIEGAAKSLTGKLKEGAGKVLGNQKLEAKGSSEQIEGKAQRKMGQIKRVFDM